MSRPIVYIAGPISKGDLAHNINQATEAFVALALAGFAPWCPQWSVYAKPAERWPSGKVRCVATANGTTNAGMNHATWLDIDKRFVEVSHAVLRLPGESTGADIEVAHAQSLPIPVFTDINTLIAYFRGDSVILQPVKAGNDYVI